MSDYYLRFKGYYLIPIGIVILLTSFLDNVVFPSYLDSSQGRSSFFTLLNFVSLLAVCVVVQFLLLNSAIKMNLSISRSNKPSFHDILIVILLGFLVFLLLMINSQLFQNRSYSLSIFILILIYDLTGSAIIIAVLVFKLSMWTKRKRNFHGFLYVLSFSLILVTLVSSSMGLIEELDGRSPTVTSKPNPWDNISTVQPIYYDMYRISSLISFGLFWIATSILLRNYSTRKIGKRKYWILVAIPMIYYIGTFDFALNNYLNPLVFQYPNFSTIIFYLLGITKQIGGFFFALSFIFMAKNIPNKKLKFYLQLTAVGIMMLFSSIQISTLHILPYPPFGLITLSIMPISAYLVLLGLYNSARSISYDKHFLSELRKQIKNESNLFLKSIGSAEWNRNLEMSIDGVLKQIGKRDDTNYSLGEEDVRDYVVDVLNELKKQRKPSAVP
ncbi:MAG TPA: hypothetical protein VJ772_00115 [Nitrososphaeraceae archaeon]|nr:hypothetical protein [Nitrososphaeraceae archaeon]